MNPEDGDGTLEEVLKKRLNKVKAVVGLAFPGMKKDVTSCPIPPRTDENIYEAEESEEDESEQLFRRSLKRTSVNRNLKRSDCRHLFNRHWTLLLEKAPASSSQLYVSVRNPPSDCHTLPRTEISNPRAATAVTIPTGLSTGSLFLFFNIIIPPDQTQTR